MFSLLIWGVKPVGHDPNYVWTKIIPRFYQPMAALEGKVAKLENEKLQLTQENTQLRKIKFHSWSKMI